MPTQAYMNNKNGEPILATDVGIEQLNNRFICCTKNCNAQMLLVGAGTSRAYFRSKDITEHISAECIKNSIIFHESDYAEDRFDLDYVFDSMSGRNKSIRHIDRGTTGSKQGKVGGSKNLRIHTLPVLYAMCLRVGKENRYNNILIDDLLVDNQNYERYSHGINGKRIVETSKYHKVKGEWAFLMNYPCDNRGTANSWVKIIFKSEALFWSQYNKLKNSSHLEPIIVAGEWENAPEGAEYHSQCTIYSDEQIYYAKEK